MTTLSGDKITTTFLETLQRTESLDQRDNRGKRHELWFVLLGFVIAFLRNRDGGLSSLHRSMVNTNKELCAFLGIEIKPVVSRAELPIVLQNIDIELFDNILFEYLGVRLPQSLAKWFSCDGKELRGSILKGTTRGEVIVTVVSHQDRITVAQDFHDGQKESERPCVRSLLKTTELEKEKITLDALHFCPDTLNQIEQAGGTYLVGLKENQKELYQDMQSVAIRSKAKSEWISEPEKGHGRVEFRNYQAFDLQNEYFDDRWNYANLKTLVKVDRTRYNCKKQTESKETAYYMSNQPISKTNKDELFHAIRNHWQVETSNHIRDVTLNEDNLKTSKKRISRIAAGVRTLTISILSKMNVKNIKAQLEKFADNFQNLLTHLRAVNFL